MRAAILCAVAAFSLAPSAFAQRERPNATRWIDIHQDADRLAAATKIIENSEWADGYERPILEEAGLDCATVESNTLTFLAEVGVDFATQTDEAEVGYWRGEYFSDANTILNVENSWVEDFRTIIHEAQHHANWGPTPYNETVLAASEFCLTKIKKDEEDEDDDGPGGNTGTTETCTETL